MKPDGVGSGTPLVYSNDLAGLEHRLLADHARAAHLLQAPHGVGDLPMRVLSCTVSAPLLVISMV